MESEAITKKDRWMAQRCAGCFLCTRARNKQKGMAFWLVKNIESRVCPFCRAYEKVYGRKAHQPQRGET
jgi:hypothetical protein